MVRDARRGAELVHRDQACHGRTHRRVGEQVVQLEPVAHVQEGRRLVEQEHARALRESPRDGDPPHLSPAQRLGPPVREGREVAPVDGLVDGFGVHGSLAHPRVLVRRPPHGHDVAHAKAQRDALALRHERDDPREGATVTPVALANDGRGRPEDAHVARAGGKKAGDDAKDRGFARSVGAEKGQDFPCPNGQAYLVERKGLRAGRTTGAGVGRTYALQLYRGGGDCRICHVDSTRWCIL